MNPIGNKPMSRSIASLLALLAFVITAAMGCDSSEPVAPQPAGDAPKVNVTPTTIENGQLKGANKQARSFKVQ
jgi:hypothetical protein